MESLIKKYTLKNAIDYNGKAEPNSVLGKILAENKELRKNIPKLRKSIEKAIKKINKLSLEKQRKELEKISPKLLIKVKRKEEFKLPKLPNTIKGKVITCFPPEPSKYPHLGHAKAALLNYLYAKEYNGKFILRFEDTNPELIKKEYYDAIINGLEWLGIKANKIDYSSNHMKDFYKHTEILFKKNKAYICTCSQDTTSKNRRDMEDCKCKKLTSKENLKLWNLMLKKTKKGKAIVRLKIDMKHKNAAMRDPTIMRIIDKKHPRLKENYRVWPNYDFQTSLMDHFEKITHRFRSKEFEVRKDLQIHINKLFNYPSPNFKEMGRLVIKDSLTSGRKIREAIKEKKLLGWDDPRLTTLIALKKRGFKPEAIKNFILSTGVSKAEAVVSWNILFIENKKLVEDSNRYFYLENPKKIKIKNAPNSSIKILKHPDYPKRGDKEFKTNDEFYITDKLKKNKTYRFMHLFNFKNNKFISSELDSKLEAKLIQWLPSKEIVKVKIIMPDGKTSKGYGEKFLKDLKKDEIIQFIRFGFCKFDKKEKDTYIFYFVHN